MRYEHERAPAKNCSAILDVAGKGGGCRMSEKQVPAKYIRSDYSSHAPTRGPHMPAAAGSRDTDKISASPNPFMKN